MARSSPLRKIRYVAEASVVGLFCAVASRLPRRMASAIGSSIGGLAYRLDQRRRRVGLDNLAHALGEETTPAEREAILSGYYRHLGRGVLETQGILRRRRHEPFSQVVPVENLDRVREIVRTHGAAIFLTCHGGMWELLGASVAEQVAPLHVVFQPLGNPYLNRRMIAQREAMGVPLIQYDKRALVRMLSLLKKGKCVALLADLNQRSSPLFVDFFGRPAATVRAPGLLAVRSGLPVICGYSYRVGPCEYRAYLDEPIYARDELPLEERILDITQRIAASDERFIRAHPEQWHWNYKRWKTRPPEELAAAVEAADSSKG